MAKTYKTAGRQRLLSFLQSSPDRQFGVDELTEELDRLQESEGQKQSKSTLYRHLSELCEREVIQKFYSTERRCHVYQYVGEGCDCRSHFHGKCIQCGAIEHLGCRDSKSFVDHLIEDHGFEVYCGQSILYGLCRKCRTERGGTPNA